MFDFRRAFGACVAVGMLAGCGGSQPMTSAAAGAQSATRSPQKALKGYYLATFTTVVGSGPPSAFCLRFTSSGSWSSAEGGGVSGTYLTSGKELFASANWLASPAVYLILQGAANAKQGSGTFMFTDQNGDANGGGTFTMTGKQNKTCT